MDASITGEKQYDNEMSQIDIKHHNSDTQSVDEESSAERIKENITTNHLTHSMIKLTDLVKKQIIDHTFASKFLMGENSDIFNDMIADMHLTDDKSKSTVIDNPIAYLNDWCVMNFTRNEFVETDKSGPSHCTSFTITCKLVYKQREYATTGCAKSKKEARKLAAIAMINELNIGPQINIQSLPVVNNAMVNTMTEQSTSNDCFSNSLNHKTHELHSTSEVNIDLEVAADTNKHKNVSSNNDCVENKVIDGNYGNNEVVLKSVNLVTDDFNVNEHNKKSITIPDNNTISDNDATELSGVQNPINFLQEWCQKKNIRLPDFDMNQTGQSHCPLITVSCKVSFNGQQYNTSCCGRSKNIAKKLAVIKMINKLEIAPKSEPKNGEILNWSLDDQKSIDEQSLCADNSDINRDMRLTNPKGYVNELCSKRGYTFTYVDETNVEHSGGVFTFACIIEVKGEKIIGHGNNAKKKEAQQCAAKDAIDKYLERNEGRNNCAAVPETDRNRTDENSGLVFCKKFLANSSLDTVLRDIEPNKYNMSTMEKILAKIDCKYELDESDERMVFLSIIWRENNVTILSSFGVIDESLEKAKDIAAKKVILMLNVLKFSTIRSNSRFD